MLRKYKSLYSSTCNTFSTGEGVTITPASVTGLPTDTEITLTFDRVDSSGTKTPSKMERIRGTITGGNFVISSGGRAVEGTEQVHTSPVVEMIWNADDWNDTVDHILTEHNQDGTHKDTLVTSLKATGAVVNTGTSDVTIVTPKAIADSKVSITDKVETLTNKKLTSPVFQGTVDGWIADTDTWIYVSASKFKVEGKDVTAKFGKGTRLRFKQGAGYKYAVVIASVFSTDTTITILTNTDFTIATPTAITDNYYSYQQSPQLYPGWFNVAAPTWDLNTIDNGSGGQPTVNFHRVCVDGNTMRGMIVATGTKVATNWFVRYTPNYVVTPVSTGAIGSSNMGWGSNDHGGMFFYGYGYFAILSESTLTIPDNTDIATLSASFSFQF